MFNMQKNTISTAKIVDSISIDEGTNKLFKNQIKIKSLRSSLRIAKINVTIVQASQKSICIYYLTRP